MFKTVFRITLNHIVRRPLWSLFVVIVFGFLFIVVILGYYLTIYLNNQKLASEDAFTYPLFLGKTYTQDHPRVVHFIKELGQSHITKPVLYITSEQALDAHVKSDPNILGILSGENPFPDTLIIPLYGADISAFWTTILDHSDIFESLDTFDDVRSHLAKFEQEMGTLEGISQSILLVMVIAGILIILIIIFLSRSIIRNFTTERRYSEETKSPFTFYYGPSFATLGVYLVSGVFIATIVFISLRSVSHMDFSPAPEDDSQSYDAQSQPANVGVDEVSVAADEITESDENGEPDAGTSQGQ